MFIDARQIGENSVVETDVCIIGAGIAGITLAREFVNKRFDVMLLEGGFLEVDRRTQRLQTVLNLGRRYHGLRFSRPRCFGGASNVWGGHCVPLRAVNFERTSWIPYSGWPFTLDELQPYYLRAHDRLSLGDYDYDPSTVSKALGLPLFPFDNTRVETVLSHYIGLSRFEAQSFGMQYRNQLEAAPNITTYLGANVTAINQHPEHDYVMNISVQTLGGKRFIVSAKTYILATGGLENARLLLLSDAVQANGLGNRNDLVGRFFMEHISYRSGLIYPNTGHRPLSLYGAVHAYGNSVVRCHLALPEQVIRQHKIPDFRAEIMINAPPVFESVVSRFQALREWMKGFDALDSAVILGLKALKRLGRASRILERPSLSRGPVVYRLANYVEQVPNPDSRIRLSEKRDAFGLRRIALDWRLSPIDKEGIRVAHRLIAAEVERSGFGKMRIELPENEKEILYGANGGGHHMGTTRMHVSPRWGVVDPDCRIHGLHNIFVAGSSVFPTVGYANPTLTIVALAIRLADHINRLMSS